MPRLTEELQFENKSTNPDAPYNGLSVFCKGFTLYTIDSTGTVKVLGSGSSSSGDSTTVDLTDYLTSTEVDEHITTAINNLINSAPDDMNTLKELSDAIANNASVLENIQSLIDGNTSLNNKLDKVTDETVNAQLYGKAADGTQTMYDISTSFTANTIPLRDNLGRVKVYVPSTSYDAANKYYVDNTIKSSLANLPSEIEYVETLPEDTSNIEVGSIYLTPKEEEETTEPVTVDLTDYYNISTIDSKLSEINTSISSKQDSSDTLTGLITDANKILISDSTRFNIDMNSTNYVLSLQVKGRGETEFTTVASIDLPLETMLTNAEYDSTNKKIKLTLQNGNTTEFSVADLVSGLVNESTFTESISELTSKFNDYVTTTYLTTNYYNKSDIDTKVNTINDTIANLPTGGSSSAGQTITYVEELPEDTSSLSVGDLYIVESSIIASKIVVSETQPDNPYEGMIWLKVGE